MTDRRPLVLTLALAWIWCWESLVPSSRRATWRDRWRADLWHYHGWLTRQPLTRAAGAMKLSARASAALVHAVSLRAEEWSLHMLIHDLKFAWRMLPTPPCPARNRWQFSRTARGNGSSNAIPRSSDVR